MITNREIFGIVEHVSLPELSVFDIPAKIDTGAFSGAVHVVDIKEYKNKLGKKKLQFTIPSTGKTMVLTRYAKTYVRSSTGHRRKRHLLDTTIMVNNVEYPIRLGLSDRSDMKFEVLVGRRFLNKHDILVDVKRNQEYDLDRGKKK